MAKFIVIDGLDGCGKAVQTKLLKEELEKQNYKVIQISFPNYESDSSAPVRMYLNGEIGKDAKLLNPYMCSTFYTVDRCIQYITDWKKYFEEDDNTIILADRYISANVIHQAGKIKSKKEREEFIEWLYDFECDKCSLPREDITILLTVEPKISQKLMSKRYNNDDSKKDIHEADINYLTECYNRLGESLDAIQNRIRLGTRYVRLLCDKMFDDNGLVVDKYTDIESIEDIHQAVMNIVNTVLKHGKLDSEYTVSVAKHKV